MTHPDPHDEVARRARRCRDQVDDMPVFPSQAAHAALALFDEPLPEVVVRRASAGSWSGPIGRTKPPGLVLPPSC